MATLSKRIKSPLGALTLVADEKALKAVLFERDGSERPRSSSGEARSQTQPKRQSQREPQERSSPAAARILDRAEAQLGEYFRGSRTSFALPLAFEGTAFQERVWRELTRIPFGETASYAEIAKRIGSPSACRAVGAANGRNPISIVVPCHRVIGARGELTGFGGGIEAKAYLLRHEARVMEAAGRCEAGQVQMAFEETPAKLGRHGRRAGGRA